MRARLCLLLGLALSATTAHAQPSEFQIEQSASGDLYLKKRPVTPEAPRLPPELASLLETKERQADGKRAEAIRLLRAFLDTKPTGDGRAEGLLKLAELLWEDARKSYIKNMASYEREVEACRQKQKICAKKPKEPRLDFRESEALYRTILADHPDFRRLDLVLYLTGFAARERGAEDESLGFFEAIIKEHPDSPLFADAWMMKGEHHFASDRWAEARDAFAVILKYPDAPSYDLALFKSAWCDWKLGEMDRAAKRFKQVLDLAAEAERSGSARERRRRAQLRDEALNYLVLVFTEDDSVSAKDVYDFLASIGGERYSRDVLNRLADVLYAQAAYDRAVQAYRFLIELAPASIDAAGYQRRIVDVQLEALDRDAAMAEIKVLVDKYGPGSDWAKENKRRAARVASHQRRTEKLVRTVAKSFHAEAQADERARRSPNLELYKRAANTYDYYLGRFGDDANAIEVRFLRAEILFFKLQSFEKAGDEYFAVGKSSPVGKFHKDALLKAMAAFEKARPANVPKRPDGKRELLPVDRKFAATIDLYATLFPADSELVGVIFRNGQMFYDYGDYDEAVKRFGVIVTKYPDDPNAGAAGDRILDALVKSEDYENIEDWARKLKSSKAFQSKADQQRLDRLIVESLGKSGEKYASAGKYKKAAQFYLRVPKEFPQHALAPQAQFNAAVMFEKAKQPEKAANTYLAMVEAYPDEKKSAQAAFTAAQVYENVAYFERAAEAYELVVQKSGNGRRSNAYQSYTGDALFNAAILRQALGQNKRAITHYQAYAKRFRDRKDAEEVAFRVGVVYEDSGDDGRAERAYRDYLQRYRSGRFAVEANTRSGRAAFRLGQVGRAKRSFTTALAIFKKSKGEIRTAALPWAAEARYYEGELVYREYDAIKLDVKPRRLKRTLDSKTKLLDKAQNVYLEVVEFGDPQWAMAALYRIGSVYEGFANSIREAPVPPGFTKEEAELYRQELDNFVIDIEEKAIEAYTAGYQKALELKVYNDFTKKIRDALGKLAASQFPPERELRGDKRSGDRVPELDFVEEVTRD